MKIEQTLKVIIYSALFLIPFVPLVVVNQLFFPFITGKAFLFRILVEVAFGAWAVLAIGYPQYRPRSSWVIKAFAVFIAIMFIADLFGQNMWKSLFSNFERMEGFITLIHLFAYFIVLSSVFISEKIWNRYFNTTLVASLYVAFYGLFQLLGWIQIQQSATRLDATLGNAAYLAIYMFMHVAIAALLMYRAYRSKDDTWLAWLYGAVIILESVILYETATRGTVIGYICAILLGAAIFAWKGVHARTRKWAISILAVVAIGIVAFIALRNIPSIKNNEVLGRFASISLSDGTTQSRFLLWHMALEGAKEHPILGWGQENFNYIFNKYYDPRLYGDEQWFDRAHDVFFDWLTAGGILGLLAYLSIFASVLFMLWFAKEEKTADHSHLSPSERRALHNHGDVAPMASFDLVEKVIITGFFVGYFIHNIFVFDNIASYLMFAMMLAYVHSRSATALPWNSHKVSEQSTQIALWCSILITAVVVIWLNAPGYFANVTLIKALSVQCPDSTGQTVYCLPNGPADNLAAYQQALSYNSFGNQEIRERILDTAGTIDTDRSVASTTQLGFYQLAVTEMNKQIQETPLDARPYVLYASYLMNIGQYQQALTYGQEALKLSPKKQTIMFLVMANQIQLKQYDAAFTTSQESFLEDTADTDAMAAYATGAIYDNKPDVIQSLYPSGVPATYQFAKAYFDVGQYDQAIAMFKTLVAASPNDPQLGVSFAVTYYKAGQIQNAIDELTVLEKDFPQYAATFAQFVTSIKAGKDPLAGQE